MNKNEDSGYMYILQIKFSVVVSGEPGYMQLILLEPNTMSINCP